MTTASNIEIFAGTFSGPASPKYVNDAMIRPGTLFLYDFTDPDCNPNADGTLANGVTFSSLVDGKVATLNNGGRAIANASGKSGITVAGDAAVSSITFGQPGDFALPVGHLFEVGIHFKMPATGYDATGFQAFFYTAAAPASNPNNSQWYFDRGPDGKTFRFQVGTGGGSLNNNGASEAALGAPMAYAGSYDPSNGNIAVYRDGAGYVGGVTTITNLLNGASMYPILNLTSFIGTIYRVSLTDITASLAAEAAANYPASAQLNAAQHANTDWAFVTNTLAGAPRTPFV